jgi:hypothetical protein
MLTGPAPAWELIGAAVIALAVGAWAALAVLVAARNRRRARGYRRARRATVDGSLWRDDPVAAALRNDALAGHLRTGAKPWPRHRRARQWLRTRAGRHSRALPRPRMVWTHHGSGPDR